MADYSWDNPELQQLLNSVLEDDDLPLEDLREHPLHIRIGAVLYDDDSSFDSATRKKLGRNPIRIRLTDNWIRSLTGGDGLLKGFNDEAAGVEAVILVDPAIFNSYPEHSQRGHIFNALSMLELETETDESGERVAKTKNGRAVWRKRKLVPISPITTRHFGAIDQASYLVIQASVDAANRQLTMENLWQPEAPEEKALAAPEGESEGEAEKKPKARKKAPRLVPEDDPDPFLPDPDESQE